MENLLGLANKTSGAISTKIVKLVNKKNCNGLPNYINGCIKQIKVPNELKISDMTSISKNEDALHKSNYRAISKLLLLQKFSKEYYLINYSDFFKYLFIYLFIHFCSVDSGKRIVLNMS